MRRMSAHLARAALAPLVALVLAGCSAPQALAPEPTTKATRPLPRADAPSAPGEPLDHRTALAAFEVVTSLRCTFGESSRLVTTKKGSPHGEPELPADSAYG